MMKKEKIWLKSMEIGHVLGCHQRVDRSFFIRGYQFPVCARCTGAMIAEVATLPFVLKKKILPYNISIILFEIMLMDWSIQFCKIKESTNIRRLITGIIGGIGFGMLHWKILFDLVRWVKNKKN